MTEPALSATGYCFLGLLLLPALAAQTQLVNQGEKLPAKCLPGEIFLHTASANGRAMKYCKSPDRWETFGGDIATNEHAAELLDDTRTMTPLKVARAVEALCEQKSIPFTRQFVGARCQNTVASAGFSLPPPASLTNTRNLSPQPVCDSGANTLFGALRFTAAGQFASDFFHLPPQFSEMWITIAARTPSTSGKTVFSLESACVGDGESLGHDDAGGATWSPPQPITIAAKPVPWAASMSIETGVQAPDCRANEIYLFRISRTAETTTKDPELLTLSFTSR